MTLLCLLLVPFVGGLLCWQLRAFRRRARTLRRARHDGVGTGAGGRALARRRLLADPARPRQVMLSGHWVQQLSVPWIPRLGIRFSLGSMDCRCSS